MSVRRAASQLLPARSVHLRIVPRPANLSESREIFRVLQRFGELSVFKYLRYEYHQPAENIALAIFRDADAAQKVLDASPIRFALEKVVPANSSDFQSQNNFDEAEDDSENNTATSQIVDEAPTKDGIEEILRPSTLSTRIHSSNDLTTASPTASKPPPPMPFEPPAASQQTSTKWFQVTIDRSHTVHQDYVERQPFWKYFNPMKSLAQEDLAKKVPYIGLSDVSKRPPNAHRTPNRVLKQMNEYLERGMPTLRGMANNSAQERKFLERKGMAGGSLSSEG